MVKEFTGARVMAMEQDVPALKRITRGGKPHPVDRVLHDGEEVKLGSTTMTAHLTPGHTKGCTTWSMTATEAGKTYNVVIVCSVGWNPGYILGKYAKLAQGGPNPFQDHAGYLAYVDQKEQSFYAELARQKALQDER